MDTQRMDDFDEWYITEVKGLTLSDDDKAYLNKLTFLQLNSSRNPFQRGIQTKKG